MTYKKIRVMVETAERTIIGNVHKPTDEEGQPRLSDHLNMYDKQFLCLTDAEVKDRGQSHRVGDKREFVAVTISSITYIAPLENDR